MLSNYTFVESDIIPQSQELNCIHIDAKHDKFLLGLGRYLADGLNASFIKSCPDEIAVRDFVDYDKVNPDLSRFPLLKCYRQTDNYESGGTQRKTKGIIAYCISFPEQDRLPGLLSWVSYAINILLDSYSVEHENCPENVLLEDRSAEYRIMLNEHSIPVYAFLRFNFSFREQ